MDKFEHFFKENRLLIDTENLSNNSWKDIEHSFKMHNRRRLFALWSIAAGVLIVISLGVFAISGNKPEEDIQSFEQTSIFKDVSSDLAKQEFDYIQLVNKQVANIKQQTVPKENAYLFNEFINQLQLLDNQYDEYRNKIKETGYSDELIKQIIYNYQLKLSVLEMLQSEIDKINKLTKNKENEDKIEKVKLEI